MEWTLYNPEWRYEHEDVQALPGMLPGGTRIRWIDGETATVVRAFGVAHLVRRSAVGGGVQEDMFDLAKIDGLMTTATPIIPRGRYGGRNPIGDEPMERHNIMISADLWRKAAELGDGNASEGVRLALESASV